MFELINRNNNHQVNHYNPFREMEELERNFFGRGCGFPDPDAFQTDITDEGDHYLLEADLPGFEKKDIHLELNGDMLKISAERHSRMENQEEQNKFVRVERSYGCYTRQFNVSEINTEEIKAKYEDGVLKLTMPKKTPDSPAAKCLEIE